MEIFSEALEKKERVIHDRMFRTECIIQILVQSTQAYLPVILLEGGGKRIEEQIAARI